MAQIGQQVRISLKAQRLSGDYRQRRWRQEFAKKVNGKPGVLVAIHQNLINPFTVEVEGYGAAQFSAVDFEVVA